MKGVEHEEPQRLNRWAFLSGCVEPDGHIVTINLTSTLLVSAARTALMTATCTYALAIDIGTSSTQSRAHTHAISLDHACKSPKPRPSPPLNCNTQEANDGHVAEPLQEQFKDQG